MDEEQLKALFESPLDEGPRRRLWPWAVGLGVGLMMVAGVFLWREDGGAGAPPEDPAALATTTTVDAGPTTTTLPGEVGYPTLPRIYHQTVYDPGTERIYVWGGAERLPPGREGGALSGTWAYDPALETWFDYGIIDEPEPRFGHAMALDGGTGLLVMFGGSGRPGFVCGVSGPCAQQAFDDTWVLDPRRGMWELRTPAVHPEARYGAALAYDEVFKRLILFGGALRTGTAFSNEVFGDTWAYDAAANTWTRLATVAAPAARGWAHMAFDAASGKVLLWGGAARGGIDDLVWAFDGEATTWEPFTATGPSARWTAGFAYDLASERLVVIGGHGPVVGSLGEAGTATDIEFLGDIWLFDARTDAWEERPPLAGAIYWTSAAYDPGTDRTVMIFLGATGRYDVESGKWDWLEPPVEEG